MQRIRFSRYTEGYIEPMKLSSRDQLFGPFKKGLLETTRCIAR
jgi:hypothetical protein